MKLPDRQFHDIAYHMGEKLRHVLGDALQLVDDPKQRVVLAQGFCLTMIELAASITVESYFEDTGKKVLHGQAHAAILAASARASKDLKMERKMNLENLKR